MSDQADDRTPVKLTLLPLPDAVPATIRLRRALKCLLRSFGLKCVRIEDAPPAAADDEQKGEPS